jgi:hypothetical protein
MGRGLTVGDLVLISSTRIGLGPNAFVQVSAETRRLCREGSFVA